MRKMTVKSQLSSRKQTNLRFLLTRMRTNTLRRQKLMCKELQTRTKSREARAITVDRNFTQEVESIMRHLVQVKQRDQAPMLT